MRLQTSPAIRVCGFREQDWPQETLAVLWKHAVQEFPQSLMWRTGTPITLNEWIRWFSAPERIVLLPVEIAADRTPTLDNILGIVWIDEIDYPRGTPHFWFRKQGAVCRKQIAAAVAVLDFAFAQLTFQLLWVHLNAQNTVAVKFAKHLGFQMLGDIPRWYTHGDVRYPASVGYLTADFWQQKRGSYAEQSI